MFPRYSATFFLFALPCLPLTRSYVLAKDLFAVPDVVKDEFGWSARALFVTQRGGGARRGSRMIIRHRMTASQNQLAEIFIGGFLRK